jgi:hypothetical protein
VSGVIVNCVQEFIEQLSKVDKDAVYTLFVKLDRELVTILAFDPFGGLATARPGFTGGRITVFWGYFTQNTAAAATTVTTTRQYIADIKGVLLHQLTHFGNGTVNFATTRFFDSRVQSLLLSQKFLKIGHGFHFPFIGGLTKTTVIYHIVLAAWMIWPQSAEMKLCAAGVLWSIEALGCIAQSV